MDFTDVIVAIVLLRISSIQRFRFIGVSKFSSLLQLLLLSELLKKLLIFDFDILMLLFDLLVFKGHPLIFHIQAHHLSL
jgi:hypothetical protein